MHYVISLALVALALVLLLLIVTFFFSSDARDHFIAFFSPFVIDSVVSCKTSEAVADELLTPALLNKLQGKVAIVTGCTSGGIGAQTAAILAGRANMQVVCAGRTVKKLEVCIAEIKKTYPNAKLTPLLLDVSSLASVRAFVAAFEQYFPPQPVDANALTLLVNNAGIMACPIGSTSADGVELQMATNHLGPFLLTCLLSPRLKHAANAFPGLGARVVNVASMAHALPKPFGAQPLPLNKRAPPFVAYGRSKRANVLSAMAFAERFSKDGVIGKVSAFSLCPGNVRTNLGQNNWGAFLVYELFWFVHKTCSQGASTSLYCALKPDLEQHSGSYFIHDAPRTTAGCTQEVAEVLWRESASLAGLSKKEQAAV